MSRSCNVVSFTEPSNAYEKNPPPTSFLFLLLLLLRLLYSDAFITSTSRGWFRWPTRSQPSPRGLYRYAAAAPPPFGSSPSHRPTKKTNRATPSVHSLTHSHGTHTRAQSLLNSHSLSLFRPPVPCPKSSSSQPSWPPP
jgi:hypothetical protein